MFRGKTELRETAKWVPRVDKTGAELIIRGCINGVEGVMVVDTGAQVSLLKIGVSREPKTKNNTAVHGITGKSLMVYGVQQVCIDVGLEQTYLAEMIVTDLPEGYLAIIGYDLLREWGAIIDLPQNTLQLTQGSIPFIQGEQSRMTHSETARSLMNSEHSTMQQRRTLKDVESQSRTSIGRQDVINLVTPLPEVELDTTAQLANVTKVNPEPLLEEVYMYNASVVTLPPRCECTAIVKLNKRSAFEGENTTVVLEPTELRIHGVYCARILGKIKDGKSLVKLINVSNEELRIPKNTRLVKIEAASDNELDHEVKAGEKKRFCSERESADGQRPSGNKKKTEADTCSKQGKGHDVIFDEAVRKHCFMTGKGNLRLELEKKLQHLTKDERELMLETLLEYEDLFFDENKGQLGCTSAITHKIETGNAPPIYKRAYRVPHAQREIMDKLIKDQLDRGIIVPSCSPYAAPVIIVPKKTTDGPAKYRFCVDFRALNLVTTPDVYPLPNISETLDMLGNAKYFTTIDLASGFHQVKMDPDSEEKTAFNVPGGHYQYKRLPMGLINSPATFQRLMDNVLMGLKDELCLVYLDDVIIPSSNLIGQSERIRKVFDKLRAANLTIQLEKCQFAANEVEYLGHLITDHGVKPDPRKIEAVRNYPRPVCAKDVRSYLGLSGYYRKFIPNFAEIAKPLTQLTKKDVKFEWTKDCTTAFDKLKSLLVTNPVLVFPDFSLPFILSTDASGVALGAVLSQMVNGAEHPVAYASRQLNAAERNYSTTERELLSLLYATKYFRCYLYGRRFTAVTDHIALKWMLSLKDPSSRLMRWTLRLSEFEYQVVHKSGKMHTNADSLSRHVLGVNTELSPLLDLELFKQYQLTDPECQMMSSQKKVKMSHEKVLYYERNGNKKIIVPEKLREKVISLHHDVPTAGHAGVKKTVHRIREKFWWKTLEADVAKYIQSCHECNQRRDIGKLRAPLGNFEEPDAPFERIATDIVGPLPLTESGNRYILSVIDHFSRFVEFVALPNQTAECIARALVHRVITKFGIPKQLLTDQGANFTGDLMREMCGLLKIKKLQTSAYHPISNGRVERVHRTVASMLSHYVNKNQNDWDEYLPYVGMAINSQIHESTNYSPYEIVFGRKMNSPLEADLEITDSTEIFNDHVEHLRSKLSEIQQVARENQHKARQTRKKQYDKRAKTRKYVVGQYVYLHTPQLGRHQVKKLARLWRGPYPIIEVLSELNVKLRIRNRESIVHVNRIKPCVKRPQRKEPAIRTDKRRADSDNTRIEGLHTIVEADTHENGIPEVIDPAEAGINLKESEIPTSTIDEAVINREETSKVIAPQKPSRNKKSKKKRIISVTGDKRITREASKNEKVQTESIRNKTIALRSGRTVNYH